MSDRPARYNAGSEDSLEDEDTIVYVTAGAWCYHEEDCRHITRSSKPQVDLPKGKAVKLEYQRCPDCTP